MFVSRLIFCAAILFAAARTKAATSYLIVDDFDTSFDWKGIWLSDLGDLGITPDVIDVSEATAEGLLEADIVLWNCGNDTEGTLTDENRAALSRYLDGGGRLLLVAPGMPAEVIAGDDRAWLTGRLGCDYVMPDSPITWGTIYGGLTLEGAGASILDGVRFTLTFGEDADVSARFLNLIHGTDERSMHLVGFREIPGHLGVARDTPTDRTVLLTFPLESVAPASVRGEILERCLTWLARPRVEARAIWVVRNQLTSPESIDAFVEGSEEAGFNALVVQVRGRGDAYYRSATEPRADSLGGQPEEFDPLRNTIDAAHARGLQVHAWCNMGYVWGTGALPSDPSHVLNENPEFVMVNRSGKSLMDYTPAEFNAQFAEGRFLSLAAPAVQDYLAGVMSEIAEDYAVDGIHFDFIRYPARGVEQDWDLDYNPLTIAAFEAERGFDPREVEIDSEEFMVWLEWQRDRIGTLVGRIRGETKAVRPGIRVSAAILSRYHLGRHQAMQDWVAWLRRGQLDTACIMSYGSDNDLVVQESLLAMEGRGPGTIWTGMSASHDIGLTIDRMDRVRREARPEGLIFFPWGGFDAAERRQLREDPFVDAARVPIVDADEATSSANGVILH